MKEVTLRQCRIPRGSSFQMRGPAIEDRFSILYMFTTSISSSSLSLYLSPSRSLPPSLPLSLSLLSLSLTLSLLTFHVFPSRQVFPIVVTLVIIGYEREKSKYRALIYFSSHHLSLSLSLSLSVYSPVCLSNCNSDPCLETTRGKKSRIPT